MEQRATGLILRTRPLTETSLIVHWLTDALGRVATVARGARRPKSPFRGRLDLFHLAEFTMVRSRRSDLHTLREVHLLEAHAGLRRDYAALEQACYAAALLEQTTETDTPLPDFFELLRGYVWHLATHGARPALLFAFELKLLRLLGQDPNVAQAQVTPGVRQILRIFVESDWHRVAALRLSTPQFHELNRFLRAFLVYHLGRVPARRQAALRMDD